MATVSIDLVDGAARAAVLRGGSYLRPLLLDIEGPCARIALVGVCATLLAGDDVQLDIEVGSGAHLELVEPSGVVAYDARGGHARWRASAHIAAGGSLIWHAAPFVVSDGADVQRRTELVLDDDARVLISETLVLGRSGEDGGRLHAQLRATRAHRELLVEELDLHSPELRAAPGLLGDARALTTVALLGVTPTELITSGETLIAGPGALARTLAQHAHTAEETLRSTWARWRSLVEPTASTSPQDRSTSHPRAPERDPA
ncbi:urease accessory protein UreD [Bounagaea algeriensis]